MRISDWSSDVCSSDLTLEHTHGLRVQPPNSWGLDAYLETVRKTARIAVPGAAAGGSCEALFLWPQICSSDIERSQIEDEFGPRGRSYDKDQIDLRQFPTAERPALIVNAGPGLGKSNFYLALAARLAGDRKSGVCGKGWSVLVS